MAMILLSLSTQQQDVDEVKVEAALSEQPQKLTFDEYKQKVIAEDALIIRSNPNMKRIFCKTVPHVSKESYRAHRLKNNEAAKISREKRRMGVLENEAKIHYYIQENEELMRQKKELKETLKLCTITYNELMRLKDKV